jgi:hypothetical protein
MVPEGGLEPSRSKATDFESIESYCMAKLAVGSCYWTVVDAYLPRIYPDTRQAMNLSNYSECLLFDF